MGSFGVPIAKALGTEVTGVCSTGNIDLVRSLLKADHVVDYTRTDFTPHRDALRRHPRHRGSLPPGGSVGKRQDLLTTGQVVPVIDRTYPLDKAAEALRYLASGHTRDKVVITL